ncbi:MAG: DNA-binding protein WhiA, partial [Clostridia bacterium]|nr:DNA-binding protein WhiA [Clostridia bacterium]
MAATFKEEARRELLSVLPKSECCIKAFLSAVCKVSGTIEGTGRRQVLCAALDSEECAEAVAALFKTLYPAEFTVTEHQMRIAGADRRVYKVTVPHGFTASALEDLEIMSVNGGGLWDFVRGIPQQILRKQCCMQAYFKGLYLACGSVYAPSPSDVEDKKGGYHFELKLADEEFASSVMELLSDLRINTKMSDRGGSKLLYVKDKDD